MMSFELAKTCKIEFLKDELGQELLLRDNKAQVMMEWEKPYMEACINMLQPKGNVLEIGFGCGYSARQIQKYNPKSHTIIECHPDVINYGKFNLGFHKTLGKYDNIEWVENTWQETLHTLGEYDEIFFDDYPLDEIMSSNQRLYLFIDFCLDWHMKSGSKLSAYINSPIIRETESWKQNIVNNPKIKYTEKIIDIKVPKNCDYYKNSKALIPIIEKR